MYGWRRVLLRLFGAKIGKNVIIPPSVSIAYPWKLHIEDYSWIGDEVISQRSYLCTGSHDYTKREFQINTKPIIKEKCCLDSDVYVGPGVTIGEATVVRARSNVFKNLLVGKFFLAVLQKWLRKEIWKKLIRHKIRGVISLIYKRLK